GGALSGGGAREAGPDRGTWSRRCRVAVSCGSTIEGAAAFVSIKAPEYDKYARQTGLFWSWYADCFVEPRAKQAAS
ncbi:MAG TPA: hypothetical protein PLT98_06235, partial [Thauera aminoaromatica]|nr:hypothetical protein [Thauera aminoaromatica]